MMTAKMKIKTKEIWNVIQIADAYSIPKLMLTMTRMIPLPAAILLSLTAAGKEGSLIPVIGFFSR